MQTAPLEQARELTSDRSVRNDTRARMAGLTCVMFPALGWGLNWPATKFLLATCPPLSARCVSWLAGAILFVVAALLGDLEYPDRCGGVWHWRRC